MKTENMFAALDSGTIMFRLLAKFLKGEDISSIFPLRRSVIKHVLLPILRTTGKMSDDTRSKIAQKAGLSEAIKPAKIGEVDINAIASHVVAEYPQQRFPVIAIGSPSGALTHVWAALGIPWLPQTMVTLVKRSILPDDLVSDYAFGETTGNEFLNANHGAALYHMHDPSNDRLMAQQMAYFRFKFIVLPDAYRRFILENLEPGGTIIVTDCRQQWPVKKTNDRLTYQVGGLGGVEPEEYYRGSERIKRLLERYDSPRDTFHVPKPDDLAPESEWGFDDRLLESLSGFADENGFHIKRVQFEHPETPSPFAADLYQWWYEQIGKPSKRLFIESFTQMELLWTLKTRVIPFWVTFNGRSSLDNTRDFLADRHFDEILLSLFSNTVDAVGIPGIEEWRKELNGGRPVETIGVNEETFPIDLNSQFAFYFDFIEKIQERYPLPEPLSLSELKMFIEKHAYPGLTWDLD